MFDKIIYFILEYFIFYYPLLMSMIWIVGSIYYFSRREGRRDYKDIPVLEKYPMVSVLVPARNEKDELETTVLSILKSKYPNFEVIVVDDASTDETPHIIERLVRTHSQVRGIFMKKNVGKPTALNTALLASRGEIIMGIDADAYLEENAMVWLVSQFQWPRVGAVTGNPRVRNRTSLLAKIQVGEYSSIIGMIKRCQRILGKVLTVSGVIAAFRKQALYDIGMWDSDMITDDINVTWKLEKRFWDIRYEPNALCWILVPETIIGLFKQRMRWAQGGAEVLKRHWDIWKSWKQRRLWPIYIEYVVSIFWSYCFVIFSILWLLSILFGFDVPGVKFVPDYKGAFLVVICLIQFTAALIIDTKYEKKMFLQVFWIIWYPFIYWIVTALAAVCATPKALFQKKKKFAVWSSPDRGVSG